MAARKVKLVESSVIFNEDTHEYFIGDKRLNGITGVISKYINPSKYAFVPESILAKAASRGTLIHKLCEAYVNGTLDNPFPPIEVTNFINLCNQYKFVRTEYLVSDNENYASSIDLISDNNDLFDIKTNLKLDTERLKWQLSIYAYLFELQNPKRKAGNLYGIHIRDEKCEVVKIDRIPDEYVKYILDCGVNDVPYDEFENPLYQIVKQEENELSKIYDVEQEIIAYKAYLKKLEEMKKNFTSSLLEKMKEGNIKTFESDNVKITYVAPYTKENVDTSKLKEEHPDIYKSYLKTSNVKETIKITIK